MRLVLLVCLSLLAVACKNKTDPTGEQSVVVDRGCEGHGQGECGGEEQKPGAPSADAPQKGAPQLYGAALGPSPVMSLTELLTSPEGHDRKKVQVSGYVKRACSRKGCWMELATGPEKDAPGCRVTFKDYGFLVPTNSAGSQAKLEGEVQLTRVEKSAVAHYESEGATFKNKAADGTALEVRLVATGVELTRS